MAEELFSKKLVLTLKYQDREDRLEIWIIFEFYISKSAKA